MIIQNLKIENFGVFRGKHNFDLTPYLQENKPIILFGGLNGSGKTTLFEGIKLCLYGQTSFKEYKTKKDYYSYLIKKIKPIKLKREKNYYSSIELQIEFNNFGVRDTYSVRRNWTIDGENVEETFRVLKNGQMLGTIEQEYGQTFIANLIPMGISNLFFFDGEKIQELAKDTVDNSFFKEALDSILGLDIIQTLIKDLKIYAYKQNASEDSYYIINEIKSINSKIAILEDEIGNQIQENAGIRTKLEKTIETTTKKENELTLQGAGYAKKRYEFKDMLDKIEYELEETRNRLRDYYSGLFPFTLIPDLCIQLKDIIQAENTRKNESSALKVIEEKKNEFTVKLLQRNDNYVKKLSDSSQLVDIIDTIFLTLRDVIKESQNVECQFINDFSEKELNQLLYWVDQTTNTVPKEIRYLSTTYNRLLNERVYYEDMIRKAPEDSFLDPIVAEINALYEVKGRYENELTKIEESIHLLQYQRTEYERQQKILQDKFEQLNKFERKITLLKNIRVMLDEYQDVIRQNKMEMFKNAFLESIAMIIRKNNFISDINIDANYDVELRREDGNYISKSILSNGEKQIYAISMLLALANVSGRPLPFIIDTPLARLDSQHRDNIVENFFPKASHQVIIFSTDTEIDKLYFENLSQYITRVYRLQFNDVTASSEGVEGYFWKPLEVTQD